MSASTSTKRTELRIAKGLALRITARGVASWCARFVDADGKPRRFTLGRLPAMTEAEARRAAADARARRWQPQPGNRWLPADAAAAHINTSVPTFYRRVAAGLLPPPINLDGLKRWDRLALDAAMEALQKPPLPPVALPVPRRGRGRPRKQPTGSIFGAGAQS